MTFAHRTDADLARKLELIRALSGGAEVARFYDVEYPSTPRPLQRIDWRIIQSLQGGALRPKLEVARELRVSVRTVKRRFDRMAADGSVYVVPTIDPAKVPGLLLFEFVFEFREGATPGTIPGIQRALQDRLVCVDGGFGTVGPCFGAGLYANKIGEVEELRRRAAAIPGVKRVRALLLARSVERFGWIDEMIAERASPVR